MLCFLCLWEGSNNQKTALEVPPAASSHISAPVSIDAAFTSASLSEPCSLPKPGFALVNVLSYVFKTFFQLLVPLFKIPVVPLFCVITAWRLKNQQSFRCHIVFHLPLSFSCLFLQSSTLKELAILMIFKSPFFFLSWIQFNWLFLPTAPYLASCSFLETFAGIFSYSCGSAGKEFAYNAKGWVRSLSWENPVEKGKATYSSILAWRIPWTVHAVTKSQTWMSNFHFTSHILIL